MVDGQDVVNMNARMYDPTLGRFLQADPMIQAPENAPSWNAYTYVFNNPLKYVDPTGEFAFLALLAAGAKTLATVKVVGSTISLIKIAAIATPVAAGTYLAVSGLGGGSRGSLSVQSDDQLKFIWMG